MVQHSSIAFAGGTLPRTCSCCTSAPPCRRQRQRRRAGAEGRFIEVITSTARGSVRCFGMRLRKNVNA